MCPEGKECPEDKAGGIDVREFACSLLRKSAGNGSCRELDEANLRVFARALFEVPHVNLPILRSRFRLPIAKCRTFFYFPVFSFSELPRIPQESLGFPRCLQSFSGAPETSWVLPPSPPKLPGELPGAPLKDSWKPRISQNSQKPLGSLAPSSLGELLENLQ